MIFKKSKVVNSRKILTVIQFTGPYVRIEHTIYEGPEHHENPKSIKNKTTTTTIHSVSLSHTHWQGIRNCIQLLQMPLLTTLN